MKLAHSSWKSWTPSKKSSLNGGFFFFFVCFVVVFFFSFYWAMALATLSVASITVAWLYDVMTIAMTCPSMFPFLCCLMCGCLFLVWPSDDVQSYWWPMLLALHSLLAPMRILVLGTALWRKWELYDTYTRVIRVIPPWWLFCFFFLFLPARVCTSFLCLPRRGSKWLWLAVLPPVDDFCVKPAGTCDS